MTKRLAKKPAWFQVKLDKQARRIAELEAQVAATTTTAHSLNITPPTTSANSVTNGGTTSPLDFHGGEHQRAATTPLDIESYARGFYECMRCYGIMTKTSQRIVYKKILQRYKGLGDTGYVRKVCR